MAVFLFGRGGFDGGNSFRVYVRVHVGKCGRVIDVQKNTVQIR